MTTPRHRRNKIEQARDGLLKLLRHEERLYEESKRDTDRLLDVMSRTRKALETLGMEPLPGMEAYGPTDTTSTSPVIDVKSEAAKDDLKPPPNTGGLCPSGGVSSGFAIEQVIGAVERVITTSFHPPPLTPNTGGLCPSCGGRPPWHYDECKVSPAKQKETP